MTRNFEMSIGTPATDPLPPAECTKLLISPARPKLVKERSFSMITLITGSPALFVSTTYMP
jgi:hypothetical protein